jgi:2,4-dienoyl-CoA reductase-like NADH-dependent reductase (Old Yellow Enzyme family)
MITGNVMVDRTQLGEPGNLVLDSEAQVPAYRTLTDAAQAGGAPLWIQLNHPGRQATRLTSRGPVAPSAVPVEIGGGLFGRPRALTASEVTGLIAAFARSAQLAQQAGFAGVQIHAAHGYLISQFLSPRTNLRDDAWGGNAARRRGFLLEILRAVRGAVGAGFPVSVKLNATDFQQGGFVEADALGVLRALNEERIDLVEITGGTYERSLAGRGTARSDAREAYFTEFAQHARGACGLPLALTGGFRSRAAMNRALLEGGVDVVGLGRPVALDPFFARRLLGREIEESPAKTVELGVAFLDALSLVDIGWYEQQIQRLSDGRKPDPALSPWTALARYSWGNSRATLRRLSRLVTPR